MRDVKTEYEDGHCQNALGYLTEILEYDIDGFEIYKEDDAFAELKDLPEYQELLEKYKIKKTQENNLLREYGGGNGES